MPSRERVLISGEELTGGLAAVRALRAGGYDPWVAQTRPNSLAARSRSCKGVVETPDPAWDPTAFVEALVRASERFQMAAVLPGSEDALLALAARRDSFPAGVAVGCDDIDAVERALRKPVLHALAAQSGLRPLPSVLVRAREARLGTAGVTYPAVLKPARTKTVAHTGKLEREPARLVRSADEFETAMSGSAVDEWLLQPFVEGRLAASCGVAWNGDVVCMSHQIAERIWPPGFGISAYAVTVPPDKEREDGVRRLIKAVGWSGIFQVQFLLDHETAYVIDLNPRFYGSLALAVAAGLNLPTIWVNLLLGRPTGELAYRVGTRYRAEANDFRALAEVARTNGWAKAARAGLPRRRTAHAVFSLRDPLPALARVLARFSGR